MMTRFIYRLFMVGCALLLIAAIISPWVFSEQLTGYQAIVNPPKIPEIPPALGQAAAKPWHGAAWLVQIGNFSQVKAANQLALQIEKSGIWPQKLVIMPDSSQKYRILLGPFLAKEEAEQIQRELQKKLQLDGIIVPF